MTRHKALFYKFAVAFTLCWLVPTSIAGQHKGQGSSVAGSSPYSSKLAKPYPWLNYTVRLFKNDQTEITFRLYTSWIPGEDRKGRFRYKLEATVPLHGEGVTVDSIEKILKRTQACQIFLIINDKYGFQLRSIPIIFTKEVDSSLNVQGLFVNSADPMDVDEYRSFIGDSTDSGNWNIEWNCPSD